MNRSHPQHNLCQPLLHRLPARRYPFPKVKILHPIGNRKLFQPNGRVSRIHPPRLLRIRPPQDLEPTPPEPATDFPPTVVTNPSQETGTGYLRIEVTTARQAVPVEGAYVVVRQMGDGDVQLERVMRTDSEGKTATISLPTVPASLSMNPGTAHPYTEYTVQVDMPGYISVRDFNIPIYDGIVAIQPVDLSPLPEGDTNNATQDIYESGPQRPVRRHRRAMKLVSHTF